MSKFEILHKCVRHKTTDLKFCIRFVRGWSTKRRIFCAVFWICSIIDMNLFYAVAIVFGILMMLILGTPQGAIRWNLFFHEGVQEALYSNVERIEQEDNSRDLHYSVVVNGEQQEWEVICLQTTCIARRLSE